MPGLSKIQKWTKSCSLPLMSLNLNWNDRKRNVLNCNLKRNQLWMHPGKIMFFRPSIALWLWGQQTPLDLQDFWQNFQKRLWQAVLFFLLWHINYLNNNSFLIQKPNSDLELEFKIQFWRAHNPARGSTVWQIQSCYCYERRDSDGQIEQSQFQRSHK